MIHILDVQVKRFSRELHYTIARRDLNEDILGDLNSFFYLKKDGFHPLLGMFGLLGS